MIFRPLISSLRPALGLLSIALAVSACGIGVKKKKGRKVDQPKVVRVFIHGDPMQLVNGTALITQSIFPAGDGLESFNDFDLIGGFVATEQTVLTQSNRPVTQESLETDNAANTGSSADKVDHYKFSASAGGAIYDDANAGPDGMKVSFARVGDRLELRTIDETPVTLLHASITPDKSTFSLLAHFKNPRQGNGLISLTFSKNVTGFAKPADVDKKFKYLLGPGIRAGWSGPIKINLCGPMRDADKSLVKTSLELWASVDHKLGDRPFEISETPVAVPFSDVNVHCIMMVDNFLFETDDDSAILGITFPGTSKTTRTIVDSDIVISRKAFEKLNRDRFDQYRRTIAHEFGHYLGLDHEFEKFAGRATNPSVMSYDSEVGTPTAHDFAAIAALYSNP